MLSSAASNTTTTTTVSSVALPSSSSHLLLPQPLTSSPHARSPNPMSPPIRPPPIYEPPSTSISRRSRNFNDLPSTSNPPIQPPSPWGPASTCNPCYFSLNHSPSSLSIPTAPPLVSIYPEKTPNQPLGKGCPPQVINHWGGGTTQRNSATSSQFVAYDMIDDFFGSRHTLQSTSNSSKSATKKDDIGRSVPSTCSKPFTITKNLFYYGFLFPPFWILGGCFLFILLPRKIRDAEGTLELYKECGSLQEGLQEEKTWGVRCVLAALALIVLIIIVAAAVLGSKHVSVNSTLPLKHTSPFVVVG